MLSLGTKQVFQSHPSKNRPKEEEALIQRPPTNLNHRLKRAEDQEVISSLKTKKSLGYDLTISKILKKLPIVVIKYLTQFIQCCLLIGYFPAQWKVAQMIILKPGKPNELTSYQPISPLYLKFLKSYS
jgi:hypothetical protein